MKRTIHALAAMGAALVFGCAGADEHGETETPGETETKAFGPSGLRHVALPDDFDPRAPTLDSDVRLDEPDAEISRKPVSELGTAEQALTIVPGFFGMSTEAWNGEFGADACYFPNSSALPCLVPVDKKVSYHWVGAATDSSFPGIDFKALMKEALAGLAAQAGGFGWTFQSSDSSSTNEFMTFTTDPHYLGLGNTDITIQLPFTSGVHCDPGPGGQYCYKKPLNKCPTFLNLNIMYDSWSSLSLANQKARIIRMMKHEIGHCIGFSDFVFPDASAYLMNAYDSSTPTSFTPTERAAAQNYIP